ncbi:hypothetical protein JCM8115_004032 [Rhodotorula mucilaginosa]|uniref:Uncharacterized protein n=1 Tax=Rhodotorula mucilaginosa TaxID=5537 RepID=A0A9P7B8M3_RHOMI|nr:hypothetical protein C6P46_005447 [Rhodotorula mucilaginosa]
MHFNLFTTTVAALAASLVSAGPIQPRADDVQPAFSGVLQSPTAGSSVAIGSNITFSYTPNPDSATPHYGELLQSLDVGLQGPAPIVIDPYQFAPFGILELATGLSPWGPGPAVNASLTVPSSLVYKPGQYFLIVTEHQIAAYTENALPYRVQTYNISIEVTEQASE